MAQNRNIDPWNLEENGMNEYERQTTELNGSALVQEWRRRRFAAVNNTPAFFTGGRVHHLRSIQMCDAHEWNELFGREILNQSLVHYAQASLDWIHDSGRVLFAGQMEVSLLMQENFRPGIHVAIFIVYLTPHRRSYDGHAIQMEFGEGSNTHQVINRLFDFTTTNSLAIVHQATECQMLGYLANDGEAMDLLHSCFLQPEFAPMRFSLVEPDMANPTYDANCRLYVENQNAGNNHGWHEFAVDFNDAQRDDRVVPPPPPPIDNFAEIYQANLQQCQEEDDDDDDEDDDENYDDENYDDDYYNYNNVIPYNGDQEDQANG